MDLFYYYSGGVKFSELSDDQGNQLRLYDNFIIFMLVTVYMHMKYILRILY